MIRINSSLSAKHFETAAAHDVPLNRDCCRSADECEKIIVSPRYDNYRIVVVVLLLFWVTPPWLVYYYYVRRRRQQYDTDRERRQRRRRQCILNAHTKTERSSRHGLELVLINPQPPLYMYFIRAYMCVYTYTHTGEEHCSPVRLYAQCVYVFYPTKLTVKILSYSPPLVNNYNCDFNFIEYSMMPTAAADKSFYIATSFIFGTSYVLIENRVNIPDNKCSASVIFIDHIGQNLYCAYASFQQFVPPQTMSYLLTEI